MDKMRIGIYGAVIIGGVTLASFLMLFAKDSDLKEVEKKAQANTERIIKQETQYKFIYDQAVEQKQLNKSILEVLKEVTKKLDETH